MPGYKGHIVGGAVSALIVLFCFPFLALSCSQAFELSMCAILGALFPDIDTKSKGQLLFYRVSFCIFLYLVLYKRYDAVAFLSMFLFMPILSRHRGMFHRTWFLCGISFLLIAYVVTILPLQALWLCPDIIFFLLGALSHIWLDTGFKGMMRWK